MKNTKIEELNKALNQSNEERFMVTEFRVSIDEEPEAVELLKPVKDDYPDETGWIDGAFMVKTPTEDEDLHDDIVKEVKKRISDLFFEVTDNSF